MSWFRWFRRDDDRQLRREFEAHLAERVDDLREGGLSEAEARTQARREFGNAVLYLEDSRQVWHWRWLDDARRDTQYAVRTLARSPGFSSLAVLALALGLGVTTALFSIIDAVVLRSPYPRPEEMVSIAIETVLSNGNRRPVSPSPSDVRRWRELGRIFSYVGTGRFRTAIAKNIVETPDPERVTIGQASEGFLEVYGIAPVLGRPIGIEDTHPGAPPVALLGHAYWVSRFGADPGAVGRTIRIDGAPTTIVGVLPDRFYGEVSLWRPIDPPNGPDFRGSGAAVYGRLRSGLTLEAAARDLTEFTRQADAPRGASFDGPVIVEPMHTGPTDRQVSVIAILAAAVGFVLLIGCLNVAGLLLSRGVMREPELAVRRSLGAGRARLVRQLLTESLVLSFAGTAIGLFLAWLSLDALVALVPLSLPPNSPAELNRTVLAAAASLAVVLPLVFGLIPALRLSQARFPGAMALAGRRHGTALSKRTGQVLTALEVGLAVVLLAGAGLMVRSFERLMTVDLGFDPDLFVTMEVMPVDASPAARAAFYPPLLQVIRTLPGVARAGAIDAVPLGGVNMVLDMEPLPLRVQQVLPGYFEAVGLRPLEGRLPTEEDRIARRPIILLTAETSNRLFPNKPAVGQAITIGKLAYEVAGVVPAIRQSPFASAGSGKGGGAYLPYDPSRNRQSNTLPLTVVVRPEQGVSLSTLAANLRQAARSVGPPVVIERIRSGADWLGDQVATQRNHTVLLGLLGSFALLLTIIGIFSVTAFAVARRTQEIGVRMAFGARPADVVWHMVRDAFVPVVLGLAAGLTIAFFATSVIASFLFETTPTDPVTFVTVAVMLVVSALVAAWLPARRAARIDPVVALRAE